MNNLQNLETKESYGTKNLTLNGQAKKPKQTKGKQNCNLKPYKKNTNKAGKLRYL